MPQCYKHQYQQHSGVLRTQEYAPRNIASKNISPILHFILVKSIRWTAKPFKFEWIQIEVL